MDLCMGIKFCQNPDIFQESQVLDALGLAVALELGTIRAFALWKKQCKKTVKIGCRFGTIFCSQLCHVVCRMATGNGMVHCLVGILPKIEISLIEFKVRQMQRCGGFRLKRFCCWI